MRKIAIVVLLLVMLGGSSAWAVGESATDFSLRDMKNASFRLSDHLGKNVILISFWMSWCKPCLVEMPQLDQLYQKHKAEGFLVISINADEPSGLAQAKTIVRQKRVTYPVLFDSDTKVTAIYNPGKLFPYTVIIGKDGKIAYVKSGFSAGDLKTLEEKILPLLSEKPAE